jgi:glutamate-ammonia-ligase adenylyltransferase
MSRDEAAALRDSYALMWSMQAAAKLLTDGALDLEAIGQGGRDFLLREVGVDSIEALNEAVDARSRAAEAAIEAILARKPGEVAA